MNFIHPCQILKAEPEERTNRIKILIRASSEGQDSAGEVVLKSAFADKMMRTNFEKHGYYDWCHLTDLIDLSMAKASPAEYSSLQIAKAKAIMGYPNKIGFKDDFPSSYPIKDDGVYSEGYLIPDNDFVIEMRKGLKAGMVYGASISGFTPKSQKVGNTIRQIELRKIALQPLNESVNKDTAVMLMKGSISTLADIVNGIAPTGEVASEPEPQAIVSPEREILDRLIRLENANTKLFNMLLSNNPKMVTSEIQRIIAEAQDSEIALSELTLFFYECLGVTMDEARNLASKTMSPTVTLMNV
jgi:hypothetical protein